MSFTNETFALKLSLPLLFLYYKMIVIVVNGSWQILLFKINSYLWLSSQFSFAKLIHLTLKSEMNIVFRYSTS